MKKSQLDTEIDENPKNFQFSKFYAVFLKTFQQTPEIGMLERVNKEQMLSHMLSGTMNAAFQMKNVRIDIEKGKISKCFLLMIFLQLLPNYR